MIAEIFDYEQNLLRDYDQWAVYLHENQAYLGRNYVALKRGEDDEELDPFVDTTLDEREEFAMVVGGIKTVLDELYQPTRLNHANLRNSWHHCHWHVVPRYEGPDNGLRVVSDFEFRDMNPGRNYTPYPKTEVPEEVFSVIRSDMRDALENIN